MATLLPVERALEIVRQATPGLPDEEVPLAGALGRVLRDEVRAAHDYPPFEKSLMDGFAVIAADLETVPRTLRLVQEIPAGTDPATLRRLESGMAARIMTGAPVPPGADAVLMVEESEPAAGDASSITARATVRSGANLAHRGEDVPQGERLLGPGDYLGPGEIAVLAAAGRSRVRVGRRPRVAIIATGDELVDPGREPGPGQIFNSNGPLLEALARRAGAETRSLGIVPDDEAALRQAISEGLRHDALLMSGGVSMGTRDLVAAVLRSLGVEILFDRVAIKPGKPFTFGRRNGSVVFGCPGNPVSVYVVFQVFARPALRRMAGFETGPEERQSTPAVLQNDVRQKPGRTGYYQARATLREGCFEVTVLNSSGSADFAACARGNALAIIPAGRTEIAAGESIATLLLDDYLER